MVLSSSYNTVRYHNKLIYYQKLRESTPENFAQLYMEFPELWQNKNFNEINLDLRFSVVSCAWEYQTLRNASFLNILIGIILISIGFISIRKFIFIRK
jgi:hypothetical protein